MNKINNFIIAILLMIGLTFSGCSNNTTIEEIQPQSDLPSKAAMLVHFIDVGQGDCTLIQCNGENMLVDCGEYAEADKVKEYLESRGVRNFKYVIGTHPHSDHIGGLDKIIENYTVETLIMPEKSNDAPFFEYVLRAIKSSGLKITKPVVGQVYNLGDAQFTIIAPISDYEDINNVSVGIRLVYGNTAFVLCGDAEKMAETDIVNHFNGENLSADVLKLGHHGSSTSSCDAFLDAVNPSFAIASCGADNRYGHPHRETLAEMKERKIQLWRTDEDGTIVFASDGGQVYNTDALPSYEDRDKQTTAQTDEAIQATTESQRVEQVQQSVSNNALEVTYILNTNSKKYHLPSCDSAKKISAKNKQEFNGTKGELQSMGYQPCESCKP